MELTQDIRNKLNRIDKLRRILNATHEEEYTKLIVEMIEAGVYPHTKVSSKIGIQKMVEGYGAYWFEYDAPHICPHCRSDLRDLENGPPFKREISNYSRELDRTVYYTCPDCQKPFERGVIDL